MLTHPTKFSVVVTVKNEEKRIKDCLATVYADNPDEVILVDGESKDKTLEIARTFGGLQIIESHDSTLTRDRQVGIDAARNEYVAMIDADHRVELGDITNLISEMKIKKFDAIQSGLICAQKGGFWDAAEGSLWDLVQNVPGKRVTIGGAPTIYTKGMFDYVRFDDRITRTTEDTDFFYRVSKFSNVNVGVGATKIKQYHFSTFNDFVKKYMWYGKGDGEFCQKHPPKAYSMIFHLLIRYPLIYSVKALIRGNFRAIPICILQGTVRFYALSKHFFNLFLKKIFKF